STQTCLISFYKNGTLRGGFFDRRQVMDSILIKIFATAPAFSQVTTRLDGVKTEFDAVRDRSEVAELLSAGCAHMRKAFDIEDINLDDLIATAMDDKEALSSEIKALKGLKLADLHVAYRQFCKVDKMEESPVDLGQVITFYNSAVKDLPDAVQLKHLKLPGASVVLDSKSERLAEIYVPNNRRIWVKLADIPEAVRNAFVAAEDKRFFQHTGIDERGLVRAFIGNFTHPGRPQGGSTITPRAACLSAGPHAGRRHDRRRRGATRIAAARRVPGGAPGLRLSLRRSHRPRGKGGRGPRYSHQFLLHGALDRQLGLAARSRGNIAGGPRTVRAEQRALQI